MGLWPRDRVWRHQQSSLPLEMGEGEYRKKRCPELWRGSRSEQSWGTPYAIWVMAPSGASSLPGFLALEPSPSPN